MPEVGLPQICPTLPSLRKEFIVLPLGDNVKLAGLLPLRSHLMTRTPPRILTIAGSDSGGGAGIQADLKTITALGGIAMSAITALTAQNTFEVRDIHEVPAQFVATQIDAVAEDIGVDVAKTGMLANASIVETVADRLKAQGIERLVLDPVMVSKSGAALLKPEACKALTDSLLPLALVVTPNLPEAAKLADMEVQDAEGMQEAAKRMHDMGPQWVLVKGGHLEGEATDLLFDGRDFTEITRTRVHTKNSHGTGCTFASAIATMIGHGLDVPAAVDSARDVLQRALQEALPLGQGHGPVNHAAMFRGDG